MEKRQDQPFYIFPAAPQATAPNKQPPGDRHAALMTDSAVHTGPLKWVPEARSAPVSQKAGPPAPLTIATTHRTGTGLPTMCAPWGASPRRVAGTPTHIKGEWIRRGVGAPSQAAIPRCLQGHHLATLTDLNESQWSVSGCGWCHPSCRLKGLTPPRLTTAPPMLEPEGGPERAPGPQEKAPPRNVRGEGVRGCVGSWEGVAMGAWGERLVV